MPIMFEFAGHQICGEGAQLENEADRLGYTIDRMLAVHGELIEWCFDDGDTIELEEAMDRFVKDEHEALTLHQCAKAMRTGYLASAN